LIFEAINGFLIDFSSNQWFLIDFFQAINGYQSILIPSKMFHTEI